MTEFSKIIRDRRERVFIRQGYIRLAIRILLIVLVVYVVLTQVFLITQAEGMGMFPSVKDGDLIIAFRLQDTFEKNNVIVYEHDGALHVGRILARGTDYVDIDDEGTLRVNGTVQTGEILYPTYPRPGAEYPIQVPENSVYVLGDYRTNTQDSRDYGSIPMDKVKGKVITIFRRRGL